MENEALDKKQNWFAINGEFRTTSSMTTTEFMNLLDRIEETYGIRFLGAVEYAETRDEDYE
ncbi:hypothetical protein [Alicyclobacillus mengziensis]|uniref:Uncharacterized protein n=1 Tax=Alicyclobacillus mengziensis TaxID=2931921 RepID=A0A9X7W0W2_9BACL|nr:hypothetical protein [Alicyclobacillus mengziensis]QSO48397.1 hypothetical protein JZ786_05260 [Alicyclobacillus mengziensis]